MANENPGDASKSPAVTLEVRKIILATPQHLFDAWTQPDQLIKWWGPANVTCTEATVDLRIGGHYRIANRFPDGQLIWITGQFETIDPPHKLIYTWQLESHPQPPERVTVLFKPLDGSTEVIIIHQQIPDTTTRDQHHQGWIGCLDGLEKYLTPS